MRPPVKKKCLKGTGNRGRGVSKNKGTGAKGVCSPHTLGEKSPRLTEEAFSGANMLMKLRMRANKLCCSRETYLMANPTFRSVPLKQFLTKAQCYILHKGGWDERKICKNAGRVK